jgi:hypothetical protein
MILPVNFMSSTPAGMIFDEEREWSVCFFRHARRLDTSVLRHGVGLLSATTGVDFTLPNSVLTNRRTPASKTCHSCKIPNKLTKHASSLPLRQAF